MILCTGGREVDDDTIVEAAKLAAWFSQAREGANVPVDYTPVKNVKKPAGARPGMVIYSTCRTVNVAPEEGLVKNFNCHKKVVKRSCLLVKQLLFPFKISKNRNLFCAEWLLQNGSKGLQ